MSVNRDEPRTASTVRSGDEPSKRRYYFACGRRTCSILHVSERAARIDLGWLFPGLVIGPCTRIEQVLPKPSGNGICETSF